MRENGRLRIIGELGEARERLGVINYKFAVTQREEFRNDLMKTCFSASSLGDGSSVIFDDLISRRQSRHKDRSHDPLMLNKAFGSEGS